MPDAPTAAVVTAPAAEEAPAGAVATAPDVPDVPDVADTAPGRFARLRRWGSAGGLVVALAVSFWSLHHVPHASWQPALLGLLPWVVGKYVLCPMRWHALSASGRRRWWHLRVYAEGELLGLASPGHIGADLWRVHRLQKNTPLNRPSALAEVGLDRLVGAIGLTIFVVVSGASLPPQLLLASLGIAAAVVVGMLVLRRVRPGLFASRPMPPPRVLVRGVLLSMGYQLTIMGLLMGNLEAVGQEVRPLALLGVFGASQVAGIIPGVNGASPREGALVVGLASLGVAWQAALGAVALTSLLAWGPALLLGGVSLMARRMQARQPATV